MPLPPHPSSRSSITSAASLLPTIRHPSSSSSAPSTNQATARYQQISHSATAPHQRTMSPSPRPAVSALTALPACKLRALAQFAEDASIDGSDASAPRSDPPSSSGKRSLDTDDDAAPSEKRPRMSAEQRLATMADAVSTILHCLGEDPLRQGLQKTPMRYAKALLALTEGYGKTAHDVLGDAEFDENHSEMVLVRNIDVFSLCEHHLLPFHGSCHVAYIPSGTVIGLSKIARIVDVFARRLQVQERLTAQIADAVQDATNATGVMVYLSCSHMCMSMRGVQKVGSETATTAARGRYRSEADMRRDFLTVVGGSAAGR